MVVTAAAGCISLAQETLRVTMANVVEFQTLVGAADAAAALGDVYHEGLPPPADENSDTYTRAELEALRPYALIWTEEEQGFRLTPDSADGFSVSGTLHCQIEHDIDPLIANDAGEVDRQHRNLIGKIIDELKPMARLGPYLAWETLTFSGPFRRHPDDIEEMGNSIASLLTFTYGGEQ